MAMIFVTNDTDIELDEGSILKSYGDFYDQATGEGFDDSDAIYLDVNSVPDEDTYKMLSDVGIVDVWVTLTGDAPAWFDGELNDMSEGEDGEGESSGNESEMMEAAAAMSMMDENPMDAGSGEKEPGRVIVFGSSKGGTGKELENSMPVLTENGWLPIGEIKTGMKVWTPKGTLTEVTGVFPQGNKDIYRLTTMAGQWVDCGADHLWETYRFDDKKTPLLKTTKDLIESGLEAGSGRSHYYKWKLPVSQAIPFSDKELPVDPYVLGAFIGDGCLTLDSLTISSDDEPVVAKIASIIGAKRYEQAKSSFSWNFYRDDSNKRIQRNEVLHDVPEIIGHSHEKHIPEIYKTSSIEQRWALIQGLFDTDGSCFEKGKRKNGFSLSTVSEQLAYDIREILYSLGIESRISVEDRRGQKYEADGKEYERKSVEFGITVCCHPTDYPKFFTLERKLKKAKKCAKKYKPESDVRTYDRVSIKSIQYLYKSEATCISVADEDGLFITKDYIVTHNTFTSVISAVYYAKDHPGERIAFIDLDIEEPQTSIVIRQLKPTLKNFYADYLAGDSSFETMSKYRTRNPKMPENIDFYLTPRDAHMILDNDFWLTCMSNLFMNYDVVVIDTGTSYMTLSPIIMAYKVADKVNIVTNASIASSVTVSNQIKRLTGEIPNDAYSEEDGIGEKIHLVITGVYDDSICNIIVDKMKREGEVIAMFGIISEAINRIEILSEWDYYDDNPNFRNGVREIMA